MGATRDTAVGLVLLVLAGLYWLGADRIRVSALEGIVGAQTVPKGLALGLAILAALLIAQDLWRGRRGRAPAATAGDGDTETEGGAADAPAARQRHRRAAGMLLIGVGYLAVVETIGYVPAIALLVLATALYMGRRPSARLVLLAAAGAVLYYLLFVVALGIPLPSGIWPGVWRGVAG